MKPLQNVQFCSSSRKAKILTTGIYWIFRGLKFETDAEIGQKGTLCKGLIILLIMFIGLSIPCYGGGNDSFVPWEFNKPVLEKKVIETPSVTGYLLMRGVKIFSKYISPVDGDRCPMYPTCAVYSLQVIKKHGGFLGFIMTADRLIHESSEMDYVPLIKVGDRFRFYDPVSNNDFWWYNELRVKPKTQRGNFFHDVSGEPAGCSAPTIPSLMSCAARGYFLRVP